MTRYKCKFIAFLWIVFIVSCLVGCKNNHHHAGDQTGQQHDKPPVQNSVFPLHVGDVGPIAKSNPRQQPFACYTQNTKLGQPLVDNHDGVGFPVSDKNGDTIGYSANCLAPTRVFYYYRSTTQSPGDDLKQYDSSNPPDDVKTMPLDGKQVPMIFRQETGVINRFIYAIYMPAPPPDKVHISNPDTSEWNGDLVFHFGGGVGIGHSQSEGFSHDFIDRPDSRRFNMALLKRGYAVVSSTGTNANTTYNLKLMGQTAHMVKQQFVAAYGTPRYTFGLGDSGGSVQQFIYAQNDPSLIDALIPLQVFPDMITQVAPVGDCELMQFYFDKTDAKVNGSLLGTVDPKWMKWSNRQMITGFHGIDLGLLDPVFNDQLNTLRVLSSTAGKGSDVCRQEWFGAVPQYMNPYFAQADSLDVINPKVLANTPLSFFDDLKPIFGTIPGTDLGRSTWDNVGVQYGLVPLKRGKITKEEFLNLNAHAGGWVPRQDMVKPVFPFVGDLPVPPQEPKNFDPWSARNSTAEHHQDPSDVAPRARGSIAAMQAAYKSGLVFMGDIDQPIIIIEPYMEPELNMHASREPFAVRHRLIEGRGNADNLAIWMIGNTHTDQWLPFVLKALQKETQWLNDGQRPASVQTGCWDKQGKLIAKGKGVFAGETTPDGSTVLGGMHPAPDAGDCTKKYPIYSDARIQSGGNVSDHVFKCALKPANTALTDGSYGDITFNDTQKSRLKQIFPHGVCDYSKPDQGLPEAFH